MFQAIAVYSETDISAKKKKKKKLMKDFKGLAFLEKLTF